VLAFRSLCGQVHREIGDMAALAGHHPSEAHRLLGLDLDQVVQFAGRVGRLKQTGSVPGSSRAIQVYSQQSCLYFP
jgi:hypothetical protein